MAIKNKRDLQRPLIELDLTGPKGNVFHLLAVASDLSRQFGLPENLIKDQMKSGSYENAIKTFDAYFGDYVILLVDDKNALA